LVAESGAFGLKVVLPVVPAVVFGTLLVVGWAEVETPGDVTTGIETVGAVFSPELSLPQPAAITPMASAKGRVVHSGRLIKTFRRGPAGEVRSRGSR
jgi:hypothetical protein